MNVVVATSTGLVKTFDTKKHQVVNLWGKPAREEEITKMIWADAEESQIVLGKKNGTVSTNALATGNRVHTYSLDGAVTGLQVFPDQRILACTEDGEIGIFSEGKELEKFTVNRTIESILFSGDLVSGCQNAQAGPSADGRIVIAGGEGQLAQMLDLETKKILWNARNVPLDFLDVEVPMHDRCLAWINPQHTFACVTAHKHLRVYDIRAQRRPTITVEYGERPFVCIAINPTDPNVALVADTAGNLASFDLRRNFARIGGFKGVAGSIRSMAFHPTEPLITCGLCREGRFVKINLTSKVYLKQRLNAVLLSPLEPTEEKEEEKVPLQESEEEEESDEVNDILQSLPTIDEVETKKRKQPPTKGKSDAKKQHKKRRSK